ncbi:nucleolin-like [Cucurbita maxima]|uniref:Nucleolin-like n=1 Tax=Cucurbita maxima TaxID=3661 RepID=A0A6J1I947_CUCMA|nr:nucleolin-like [Cucurbita maxima]
MAELCTLYFVLPQVEPYDAVHLPDDLDDGEKILDGAIPRREVKSKLTPMYLRYGYLMAENLPPNALSEKQVLDRLPEVVGGEEDENGDCVFEINFSQENCNYVVQLFFSPKEESDDDDEDSHQEEEAYQDSDSNDMEEIGEDYDSDDMEEIDEDYDSDDMEEIDEDYGSDDEKESYEDEQKGDEELTGNRVFELYFPQGDRNYVVRLVFVNEEGTRFLDEGEEFLFVGLQRLAGISYDIEELEDEVPAIDNKSSSALSEVVSEISRRLMESKVGEPDDIRTAEEAEKQSRFNNEICTFIDPQMILERPNYLTVRDHLQLHSSA